MSYLTIKIGAWFISGLAAFTLLWDASKPSDNQPVTSGQVTITLTSIVPTTTVLATTTTTAAPKGCMEYLNDAILAGWPISESPTILRVLQRESACNPLAFNGKDRNGGSRGLFQVNGAHKLWLIEAGIIIKLDDLFYPDVNIKAALHLWHKVGWQAWNLPSE